MLGRVFAVGGKGYGEGDLNYYRRYIGDYHSKTMRLTPTDHGVYGLMLDYCYAEEKPLPLDMDEIHSICKAVRPEDRKAVAKVLAAYFDLHGDGYHNKRADKEIATSQQARVNGKKGGGGITDDGGGEITGTGGGHPPGIPHGEDTGEGGETVHPPTTNHQPSAFNRQPLSANRQPGSKASAPRKKRAALISLPADFVLSDRVKAWGKEKGFTNLQAHYEHFVIKARSKDYQYADWDEGLMGAITADWAGLYKGKNNGNGSHGLHGSERDSERAAARRAILHPAGAEERDVTGDSERMD